MTHSGVVGFFIPIFHAALQLAPQEIKIWNCRVTLGLSDYGYANPTYSDYQDSYILLKHVLAHGKVTASWSLIP